MFELRSVRPTGHKTIKAAQKKTSWIKQPVIELDDNYHRFIIVLNREHTISWMKYFVASFNCAAIYCARVVKVYLCLSVGRCARSMLAVSGGSNSRAGTLLGAWRVTPTMHIHAPTNMKTHSVAPRGPGATEPYEPLVKATAFTFKVFCLCLFLMLKFPPSMPSFVCFFVCCLFVLSLTSKCSAAFN